MSIKIKLRGKVKNSTAHLRALVRHPMKSGLRLNKKTNKPYQADYIKTAVLKVNGKVVMRSYLSAALSDNPYFEFRASGEVGDKVSLLLTNLAGETGLATITLK